jgi:Predicted nucleotide-binding protein containing TIR-like domain
MRVFEHRRDAEYLQLLNERLTISGPNGLLAKAVNIVNPFEHEGKKFTRCCRIDFAGVAATNLFDTGHNVVPTSAADLLENLFAQADELNEAGIFIKLRFLLVYPYCTYAIARMQAELSRNRSSIGHPQYNRDFHLVESVDEDMFKQSSFVIAQTLMLEQIQEWIDKYSWPPLGAIESTQSVNRAFIRFASVSPNLCVLFVNDTIFTDPYLLAKELRERKRLAHLAPLVQIEKSENPNTFAAFDDHFRYIWDLDQTIYAEDATYYQTGRPNTLKLVKPPEKITFENKAKYIKLKAPSFSDSDIQKWRFKVSRVLNRHCTLPAATPSSESLFITCSWEKGGDSRAIPNSFAQELSLMLETDFGRLRPDPVLSVHIMEGVAGEFLTRQLYARLEESTLALVLMTGDIQDSDGKLYCRPNVYHELGFLMKHIGTDRVIIVREEGITIPSNIQDVIRVEFSRDKMILCYREILQWLARTCSFSPNTVLEALQKHSVRLQKSVVEGGIDQTEGREAARKIERDILSFNSNPIS